MPTQTFAIRSAPWSASVRPGGMLDREGNFPNIEKPFLVDAVLCVLASVVTRLLFAACLFFIAFVQQLRQLGCAYGPALIAIGLMMVGSVTRIQFDDLTAAIPAFATIAMMVFTYTIAIGLAAGLILYPLVESWPGAFAKSESVTSFWRLLILPTMLLECRIELKRPRI